MNWNDAIIRVNFADSGFSAPGLGIHKRAEMKSDNSDIGDNNMMEMALVPGWSRIIEMHGSSN